MAGGERILQTEPVTGQYYALLARKISSGEYPPGAKIPSEREAAKVYGVSHITVNKVVKQLEAVGLVRLERGRGVFVAGPRKEYGLNGLQSFTEWCRRQGYAPATAILGVRKAAAADLEAFAAYGDPLPDRGLILERLRTINGRPAVFERRLLNPALFTAATVRAMGDSYTVFLQDQGIAWADSDRRLRLVAALAAVAHRLEVPSGAKVIEIAGISRTGAGVVIDHDQLFYHPDYFEFVYSLHEKVPTTTTPGVKP